MELRQCFLLLAVAAVAAPQAQAITVAEAPGTASYDVCTIPVLMDFNAKIASETTDCATKAPYDWYGITALTDTQREELCACKLLINKLTSVPVPHCALYQSGALQSYKQVVENAFGLCGAAGTTTTNATTTTTPSKTTTTPSKTIKPTTAATPIPTVATSFPDVSSLTTSPTASPTTYPPVPTQTPALNQAGASSGSTSNTKIEVFTGGGGAILVVVAVIGAIARWRRRSGRAPKTDAGPMDLEVVPDVEGGQGELSPLDGGYDSYPIGTPPYSSQRPVPSAPAAGT